MNWFQKIMNWLLDWEYVMVTCKIEIVPVRAIKAGNTYYCIVKEKYEDPRRIELKPNGGKVSPPYVSYWKPITGEVKKFYESEIEE